MNDIKVAEMAAKSAAEVGTAGLEVSWGMVQKADNTKLFWPACFDLFNKLLRRDPQVAQWRVVTTAMASKVDWYWELPQEEPTPQEMAFLEFLHTIWDDVPGGQRKLIDTYVSYILFGWMWFENVPARRTGAKQAGTDWASVYDDGLIGFRDIAHRDHSSFAEWDIDEATGRLSGFVQRDYPNPEVTIPLARSTHVTLGDPTSPEGLSPFEALWRLESFMYNLEVVFGIGSEHAAGHAKFQSEQQLSPEDKTIIQNAARALLAAQEGNFIMLPGHIQADVIDVAFSAGTTILEGIKFYGHLKSQVLNMQWMSLSLTGDAGSNASMLTSSNMWLTAFNAQMAGAAKTIGEQLARQLRDYNRAQFGSVKRMPVLKATPVETNISLNELAQFVTSVFPVLDTSPEDMAAVRRKSNFLPELEVEEMQEDENEPTQEADEIESETAEPDTSMEDEAEFGNSPRIGKAIEDASVEFARPVAIGKDQPTVTTAEDLIDLDDPAELDRIAKSLEKWAKENDLNLDLFFNAEALEE